MSADFESEVSRQCYNGTHQFRLMFSVPCNTHSPDTVTELWWCPHCGSLKDTTVGRSARDRTLYSFTHTPIKIQHDRLARQELAPEEKELLAAGRLIDAIKLFRSRSPVGLREAKEICEKFRNEHQRQHNT